MHTCQPKQGNLKIANKNWNWGYFSITAISILVSSCTFGHFWFIWYFTVQKMKFSIKKFFSNCNIVTFTKDIFNDIFKDIVY